MIRLIWMPIIRIGKPPAHSAVEPRFLALSGAPLAQPAVFIGLCQLFVNASDVRAASAGQRHQVTGHVLADNRGQSGAIQIRRYTAGIFHCFGRAARIFAHHVNGGQNDT